MKYAICFSVLVVLACGGGEQGGGGEAGEMAAATGVMGQGSITGSVMFTGSPPANPPIDMSEEPACKEKYPDAPVDPRVVVAEGKLANVFVYVKSGLPEGRYNPPSTPVVLDQDGCLYHPRVLGIMVNQELKIQNSDPLLHNIKAVPTENRPFNISQPTAGMTTTRTFRTPEVMVPLECNVHGWMNAYVGVMSHPFYGVAGADGSFTITGLPAGTYEIEAWHETLGTQTMSVTVPEAGSVSAEFSFGAAS